MSLIFTIRLESPFSRKNENSLEMFDKNLVPRRYYSMAIYVNRLSFFYFYAIDVGITFDLNNRNNSNHFAKMTVWYFHLQVEFFFSSIVLTSLPTMSNAKCLQTNAKCIYIVLKKLKHRVRIAR